MSKKMSPEELPEELKEILDKLPACFCSSRHLDTAMELMELMADKKIDAKDLPVASQGYLHISSLILNLSSNREGFDDLVVKRYENDVRLKAFVAGIGMIAKNPPETDSDMKILMMVSAALLLDYANEEV